jgi:dihydroorotate dehydrogenase
VWRVKESGGIINRLGFPGAGMDAAAAALAAVKVRKVPIGVNAGRNADTPPEKAAQDYCAVVRTLHPFADYFALNVSSPNTAGLRDLHQEERLKPLLASVLDELARLGPKPLFLKISPDLDHATLEAVCRVVRELKVGVIAANTTTRRDLVPNRWAATPGGLSGRPLKGLANAIARGVRDMAGPDVPLIGVGGIASLQDAQGRMDAGADLVQVYTGLVYRGPGLVREIVEGLKLPARRHAEARA